MKLALSRSLYTLKKKPVVEDGEAITLGGVIGNIIAVLPADGLIKSSERKKRFLLATKIYAEILPVEIDEADVELIKSLIEKSSLPPLYSEQIIYALEGKENPLEPREDFKLRAVE